MNVEEIIKRGFIKENEANQVMNKESNLTKINLQDREDFSESIWAVLIKQTNEVSYVVLANHAICFMPARSWGLVLEVKDIENGMLKTTAQEQEDRISKCYKDYVEEWKHMFEGEDGE